MPQLQSKYEYLLWWAQKINGLPEFTASVVKKYEDVLLQLNKDQILLGRNIDGQEFRPGYLSDPYFDTPAQAGAYYNYKQKIRGLNESRIEYPLNFPNKNRDTPDLRATTKTWAPGENFQDSMFIVMTHDGFEIYSSYSETPMIVQKYQNKVFGLSQQAIEYFWVQFLSKEIIDYFSNVN